MRDDLLHAQASVDWAVSKLPAFSEEIDAWLRDNLDCRIEKSVAPNVIIGRLKNELRLSFNVEAGIYINAIRTSLDILATSLAVRYSVGKPEDTYFPVVASTAAFKSSRYKFIDGLSGAQRAIIETLQPYKGGNEALRSLHQLDIMRKHRRLLSVHVVPGMVISDTSGKGLNPADFRLHGVLALSADEHPIVLGFVRHDAADYDLQFSAQVSLNEPASAGPPEVIRALHEFASLAHSIIKLFDD